jgi:haloalkane dehalogenase
MVLVLCAIEIFRESRIYSLQEEKKYYFFAGGGTKESESGRAHGCGLMVPVSTTGIGHMKRRTFLGASAALFATAVAGVAFGDSIATIDDDAAAGRRHERDRRFLELPAGRIAYIDRGEGPVALFLHGFPLSSFQWRGAIDRLSRDRRCLAPDFMGLGYTEVTRGWSMTPAAQANMIIAFLDRLGVNEIDVIANDSGGAVAQLLVAYHPQRVKTMLLTNCDVENDSPPAALLPIIEVARAGLYADLWLEPWVNHKDEARAATGLGGACYSKPGFPSDAAIDQYLAPLVSSGDRKDLVNRYTLGLTPNPLEGVEKLLRESHVPTRVVWGMSDTIFSTRSPDYLASVLPRVTGVRRIAEAKLFFPEEYPEIIAQEARLLWSKA